VGGLQGSRRVLLRLGDRLLRDRRRDLRLDGRLLRLGGSLVILGDRHLRGGRRHHGTGRVHLLGDGRRHPERRGGHVIVGKRRDL
jgi:hypothetical protein